MATTTFDTYSLPRFGQEDESQRVYLNKVLQDIHTMLGGLGYSYIPASPGAPTGTPTARTGYVPMAYDIVNNQLYVYNGSWKKSAVFT